MVPLTFLHKLQPLLGTCTFLEEELVAAGSTSTSVHSSLAAIQPQLWPKVDIWGFSAGPGCYGEMTFPAP